MTYALPVLDNPFVITDLRARMAASSLKLAYLDAANRGDVDMLEALLDAALDIGESASISLPTSMEYRVMHTHMATHLATLTGCQHDVAVCRSSLS